MSFAVAWMDLEIIILSQARKRQIPYDITSMLNLKYNTMNLSMKQKKTRERTELLPRGLGWGREGVGVGVRRYKQEHIGWINSKVLLYSPGNYIQYLVINHSGKNVKKYINVDN